MKKSYLLLVALVVVAVLFFSYGGGTAKKGKAIFAITDATTELEGISSINLTVNEISVHGAEKGWATVSTTPKDFDLLQLKNSGALEVAAESNLAAGTYDQVRLNISKVVIVKSGESIEAKLPSNKLTLHGNLVVNADTTSTIVFDFLADQSLHQTGNGKYILSPVVKLQIKSGAEVSFEGKNVKIMGGKLEHENTQSMNENGEVSIKVGHDDEDEHANGKEEDDEDHDGDGEDSEVKLNLSSQNNSGIAGTVKLESEDGKVEVKLDLAAVATGVSGLLGISIDAAHPAHIHSGSCANIGAVKYPLNSTVSGESETKINVSLADLKAQLPLAINVHKSVEEIGVYVACVDVKF